MLLLTQASAGAQTADPSPEPGGHAYAIDAQNGSDEHGTFALEPHGEKTTVEIHLLGAPHTLQPAHLHLGTCAKLDPVPKYALTSLKDGISETSVDVPLAQLVSAGLAVNVHESVDNLKRYVACGNVAK